MKIKQVTYFDRLGHNLTGNYAIGHVAGYYSVWRIRVRQDGYVVSDRLLMASASQSELPRGSVEARDAEERLRTHGIYL